MNYTATPAEKSTVKITMTFDAEEWSDAIDKAYAQNKSKYAVNGFRKGKVPKHVLEMFYGKGLFYEDALNILYAKHYPETLEKEAENFTVVGDPVLSVEDISDEKVVLVADVPVKPDVVIETYKGIKIDKFEYNVSEEDVDKEIESVRDRMAEKVEVTDRASQMGDTVNIDFVGKVDGVEFDGGAAEGFDLTLGSKQFIPGFEEQVAGMAIGEVKDITVTFPEDYQAENLKGKAAVFTITLHKITGKQLPEMNEEFAKKMGSDSVEAYRAKVRERLEQNAKTRSTNETENAIITAIAKGATAEIPEAMISRQEEASMQRMEYNLMYQGIKLDDYLSYIGSTREEYKKNFEQEAKQAVLHQLIVEKIIALEKIEATEEEIDAKIADQAKSVGKSAEEYKKTMDPRQKEYIENDLIVTKLFDFLQANNEMVLYKEEKPAKKTTAKKSTKKAESAEGEEKPVKKTTKKATTKKSEE